MSACGADGTRIHHAVMEPPAIGAAIGNTSEMTRKTSGFAASTQEQ
jgi:hypothetical protein